MHHVLPDIILDNLIAAGKTVPMNDVMPNGCARKPDRAKGDRFMPEKTVAEIGAFSPEVIKGMEPGKTGMPFRGRKAWASASNRRHP